MTQVGEGVSMCGRKSSEASTDIYSTQAGSDDKSRPLQERGNARGSCNATVTPVSSAMSDHSVSD
eukprot:1393210-Amorphochlora_amoeboformis.AAC.2